MNGYITFEEYQTLTTAVNEVTEERFPKLLMAASDKLNVLTNNFYVFNDITKDVPFRINTFKRCLVILIDYFNFKGASASYETTEASTIQIGRTNITSSAGLNTGAASFDKSNGYPLEVYQLLASAGFLYRGVLTTCL